jgi:alpha-glucosidase
MEKIEDPAVQAKVIIDEEIIQHLNNPVIGLKPIVKKYLGAVVKVVQEGNKFYFSDADAKVEVVIISDDIIRVRLAPHGVFLEEFSYAVSNIDHKVSVFSLHEDETEYQISTNTVNCHIRKKDFFIAFSDNENHVTSIDAKPMHWEENVQFGGYYVYGTKECHPGESFFGLGDKATELNLVGKRLQNWNTDAYSFAKDQDPLYRSIPFYISLHEGIAHGIFFDF